MAKFDPKAKAKRQKIILAVLGVALVGVLIFQAPTIMGMFGGGSSSTASEPVATTPSAPVPVTPGAPAPVTPAAAPLPAGASAQLVDSDPVPVPAEGQLVTFDRFDTKDPFAQQVSNAPASSAPAPLVPVDAAAKAQDPAGDAGQPAPDPGPGTVAPAAATISVNGESHEVKVGATFPESDPIFKLVSVKGDTAKVGIVGGGYANGSQTVTLRKGGKPVTLMNTADGTTYVLRLVGVG